MSKLPFPRLELRWRKTTRAERKENYSNWICLYRLVIHPKTADDARTNTDKGCNKLDVAYDLGMTFRDGPEPIGSDGVVDTPFRDGCHAMWDSVSLHVPVYAVYKKHATLIVPRR
jgi:hypothetical protein